MNKASPSWVDWECCSVIFLTVATGQYYDTVVGYELWRMRRLIWSIIVNLHRPTCTAQQLSCVASVLGDVNGIIIWNLFTDSRILSPIHCTPPDISHFKYRIVSCQMVWIAYNSVDLTQSFQNKLRKGRERADGGLPVKLQLNRVVIVADPSHFDFIQF